MCVCVDLLWAEPSYELPCRVSSTVLSISADLFLAVRNNRVLHDASNTYPNGVSLYSTIRHMETCARHTYELSIAAVQEGVLHLDDVLASGLFGFITLCAT